MSQRLGCAVTYPGDEVEEADSLLVVGKKVCYCGREEQDPHGGLMLSTRKQSLGKPSRVS